jgi:uncharacterized protein YcfJ
MKNAKWITSMLVACGLATSAQAQQSSDVSYEQARVLNSTPIYESVRIPSSREVCWDEEVTYRQRRSPTSGLVGGLIGGAIGHQFGGGRGKDAMTVAGALIGASIANDAARKKHRGQYTQLEQRCRTTQEYYDEERVTGYRVQYEYNGQVYTTRTDNQPGEFLDLRVSVSPVGN